LPRLAPRPRQQAQVVAVQQPVQAPCDQQLQPAEDDLGCAAHGFRSGCHVPVAGTRPTTPLGPGAGTPSGPDRPPPVPARAPSVPNAGVPSGAGGVWAAGRPVALWRGATVGGGTVARMRSASSSAAILSASAS